MDYQAGPLEPNLDLDTFFRENILGTQIILVLNFLLYGAYTVLFSICVYTLLLHRRRGHTTYTDHRAVWIFRLTTTFLLFALATSSAILNMIHACADFVFMFSLVADTGEGEIVKNLEKVLRLRSPKFTAIYIIANAIADSVLIYRCYIVWGIWGNSRRIVFLPTIVSLGNTAFALYFISTETSNDAEIINVIASIPTAAGKASAATKYLTEQPLLKSVFLIVNVVNNVLLTGLIAGKIWWARRKVEQIMGSVSPNAGMYSTALSKIIESGLFYSIALAITFGVEMQQKRVVICTLLDQIVGIVPTLILVRVGLGRSAEQTPVQETLDSLRYAAGPLDDSAVGLGNSISSTPHLNHFVSVPFRMRQRSLLNVNDSDSLEDGPDFEARIREDLGELEGDEVRDLEVQVKPKEIV